MSLSFVPFIELDQWTDRGKEWAWDITQRVEESVVDTVCKSLLFISLCYGHWVCYVGKKDLQVHPTKPQGSV